MRRLARALIVPVVSISGLAVTALLQPAASASASTVAGLNVFVGYAEDKETNSPNPAAFPIPWNGSANTIFLGNPVPGGQAACGSIPICYDTGGIRLDNPTAQDVAVQDVFVDDHSSLTGGKTFDLWGAFTVPAGKSVILAANPPGNNPNFNNFDTSSYPKTCTPLTVAPTITFTIGGVATTLTDSTHVLDTGGIDVGSCAPTQNESIQWRAIGSTGINTATLSLTPSSAASALGQTVTEVATLTDGGGAPIVNAPVTLAVACGPNIGLTIDAITDGAGQASFNYSSSVSGTDTVMAQVTTVGTFRSNPASIAWGANPSAGWNCADIGNPAQSGGQSLSGGTWTVTGGGTDITGTSDQFHYLWQSVTGDQVASVHGVSQTAPSTNGKAGLMLRQSTDPGSPYYAVLASPGAGIKVQVRTTQGGTTTKLANPTGAMPVYLKLTRGGDTFSALTSPDGSTWTLIAGSTITFAMPATLLTGLAVNAHAATGISTVVFDTVSIGSGPPPPPPPPVISNIQESSITTTGATISWNTSTPASTQLAYGTSTPYSNRTPNDPTLVTNHSVTLTGLTAGTTYHFTEISTDAANQTAAHGDSTFATLNAPPPPPVISNVQVSTTTTTATVTWTTSTPASSQVVYGLTSTYGNSTPNDPTLVTNHSVTVSSLSPATTYHFALVSTDASNQTAASGDATFTTQNPPPPPAGCPNSWTCTDVGAPALAGSETTSGGTWTIKAGGADIYGTADQFRFDYQTLGGDGSVSAHVLSQTNTSAWAKAGVMLRATTAAGSLNYAVFITSGNGITVQYRNNVNGTTAKLTTMAATVPIYLKVTRVGTTFSASTSSDGVTWTVIPGSTKQLGTITGPLLAGLAVTSHNAGAICTVVMDTVVVG